MKKGIGEINNATVTSARYTGIDGLMQYTGLGRNRALDVGRESGAKIKIGKRSIYDLRKVDAYLSEKCEG